MTEWRFEIPGPPVPKGRPRKGPNGWYTPKRTVEYECLVAECAMASGLRLDPAKKYALRIDLYVSRWRGDLDNIAKAIEDGLNRYGKHDGWDDRQICDLQVCEIGVADAGDEKAVVIVSERGAR